ncbi:MAG TPA: general stress protein [Chondromyces sp.]|nr:general stress protein [Chondromyces sp.]
MTQKKIVENGVQAKETIESLQAEGYPLKNIYLLAHDEERTKDLTEALEINNIGMKEQGMLGSILNMVNSRGDELREKMQALGLSSQEADIYEKELDRGKVLIIAS